MAYDKARVDYLLSLPKTKSVVNELVQLNFGLIKKQLQRYHLVNDEDALSLAYEALFNAIMTYDTSRNNRLSTYATVCIYNALGCYVRSLKTQLSLSVISYDAPINEEGATLFDTLSSNDTADGETLSDAGIIHINAVLQQCVDGITNKVHKSVVVTWVESEYTITHEEIATKIGITQSYVSQIIKRFKFNLKKKLEATQ